MRKYIIFFYRGIEEDSRGAGVNEALGLWNIRAYARKKSMPQTLMGKVENKIYDCINVNRSIMLDIEQYLNYLESNRYELLNESFDRVERFIQYTKIFKIKFVIKIKKYFQVYQLLLWKSLLIKFF